MNDLDNNSVIIEDETEQENIFEEFENTSQQKNTKKKISATAKTLIITLCSAAVLTAVLLFLVFMPKEDTSTAEDYLKADGINVAAIGSVAGEDNKKSNIAVFGSPIMFLSGYLDASYNNSNYIINLCNTVTDRGDMGRTIASASSGDGELGTVTAATTTIVSIIFIGAVPLIILVIGLVVFIRRRKK